jgi:hypothetical protein
MVLEEKDLMIPIGLVALVQSICRSGTGESESDGIMWLSGFFSLGLFESSFGWD